ncbi:hypothetical protein ACLIA0_11795 [Bacillaceae bacterium W0354]
MIDVLKIGPLNIYIPYLLYILVIVLTLFLSYLITRRHLISFNKKPSDLVLEYWILFIVVWKLSYFIYHPGDVVHLVQSIIFFDGGELGIVLGFLLVVTYSYYISRKQNILLEYQTLLIIFCAIVFIGFVRLISFIYVPNVIILVEGIAYLFIASLIFNSRNIKNFVAQLKYFRWALIVWVLFRIVLDEIQIYFIWLLGVIIIAVVILFIEWNDSRKEID